MNQETKTKMKKATGRAKTIIKESASTTARGTLSAFKFVGSTTLEGFKALNEADKKATAKKKQKKAEVKQGFPGWRW